MTAAPPTVRVIVRICVSPMTTLDQAILNISGLSANGLYEGWSLEDISYGRSLYVKGHASNNKVRHIAHAIREQFNPSVHLSVLLEQDD